MPTSWQPNPQITVINTSFDEYQAVDNQDPRFFIHGTILRSGLHFTLRVRDLKTQERSIIPAKDFFDAMMNHLEPGDPPFYVINGTWDITNLDLSSNLWKFNSLVGIGYDHISAAKETFTGRLAADWGYTEIVFVRLEPINTTSNFTHIKVQFINPLK